MQYLTSFSLLLAALPYTLAEPVPVPVPSVSVPAYVPGISICPAQPVLDSCLATTKAIASGCATTDYSCLCQKWSDVMTCFLQCPNDPQQPAALAYQTTYCSNAKTYGETTKAAVSAPATTSATSTGEAAQATQTATQQGSATTSGSRASSTPNEASVGRVGVVGGVLVGLAGVVGLFL